jgi:prevent-host-death family protein
MKTTTVGASEFKAKCLAILDDVAERGARIVITKRGHPVATVIPVRDAARTLRGTWKGKVRIKGDLVRFTEASAWENR